MSNLIEFAETELRLAGFFDYDGAIGEAVMELIKVFAEQEHSGMSASRCRQLFNKVAAYETLTPITDELDQWIEVDGKGLFQHKRCSNVFKDANGSYDIDGRVFREPNGACYTNSKSRTLVTFPYTPTTEYVNQPFSID